MKEECLPDDLLILESCGQMLLLAGQMKKWCDGKSTTTAELPSQRDTKSLHATLTSPQTFQFFCLLLP